MLHVKFSEGICTRPTSRKLLQLKSNLAPHWMELGTELLSHERIQIIRTTYASTEDRYYEVYSQWLDTDSTACYCKLIAALKQYDHNNAVEIVKAKALQ